MLSFGFQDNAAFILKMPRHLVDQIVWPSHTPWFSNINDTAKNFDWGKMARNTWFFNTVSKEVFVVSGILGFFVFLTATCIGITCQLFAVKRSILMSSLIFPTIFLYLPF